MRFRFASGEFAPINAADVAALEQGDVERRAGNLARGEADHHEAPLPGQRPQGRFGQRAANRIVDDVDALGREVLEARAQIVRRRVDRLVRPVAASESKLFVRRCAGDHPGAHRLADLDRGEPDPTRRTQHQQGLARLHLGALLERVQARAIGDRKARRLVERQPVRDSGQPAGGDRDPFRGCPIGAKAHDPVADRKSARSRA